MNRIFLIMIAALCLCVTACGKNTEENAQGSGDVVTDEKFYPESSDIAEKVKEKRRVLDETDAPFGVTAVYSGTETDIDGDGINDKPYAFALYNQFQLAVYSGKDMSCLLDERIMTELDGSETEVLADENGTALKVCGRMQAAAESGITETVQVIRDGEADIAEAVYDSVTGEFVHAYGSYSEGEYKEFIGSLTDGCEKVCSIKWTEFSVDTH